MLLWYKTYVLAKANFIYCFNFGIKLITPAPLCGVGTPHRSHNDFMPVAQSEENAKLLRGGSKRNSLLTIARLTRFCAALWFLWRHFAHFHAAEIETLKTPTAAPLSLLPHSSLIFVHRENFTARCSCTESKAGQEEMGREWEQGRKGRARSCI